MFDAVTLMVLIDLQLKDLQRSLPHKHSNITRKHFFFCFFFPSPPWCLLFHCKPKGRKCTFPVMWYLKGCTIGGFKYIQKCSPKMFYSSSQDCWSWNGTINHRHMIVPTSRGPPTVADPSVGIYRWLALPATGHLLLVPCPLLLGNLQRDLCFCPVASGDLKHDVNMLAGSMIYQLQRK